MSRRDGDLAEASLRLRGRAAEQKDGLPVPGDPLRRPEGLKRAAYRSGHTVWNAGQKQLQQKSELMDSDILPRQQGINRWTVGIHLGRPHATRAADMAGLQTDQATPDYTAGDSDRRAFNGYYRQLCEREGVRLAPTRCEQGAKTPRGFKLQRLCESQIYHHRSR
jgi:hypothetical protein